MDKVRIDKWLWAVRVFKTRSQAAEACKKGRVMLNGQLTKPSKEIVEGDMILVRKSPVLYTYRVKTILKNRVSAKLVSDFLEDKTSLEELDKLKVNETVFYKRDRGTGRPTKRERRTIDKLQNPDI